MMSAELSHLRIHSIVLQIATWLISSTQQHARLLEPPSRASMWRVGFPNPKNEDDNQGYCGGFGVQYHRNGGKCGICGDPWDQSPREHETPGGLFANGLIVRRYKQGYVIPIVVDVTANHNGHFEFKLCPNNNIFLDPDQACFDRYPLRTSEGFHYPILGSDGIGYQQLYLELPLEVTCEQCILQWTYVAGNNWGTCPNGTSGIGCGPQEHFRACADIQIEHRPILSQIFQGSQGGLSSTAEKDYGFSLDVITEDKEAALREKKLYLQSILAKVKQMILLTEQSDDKDQQAFGTNQDNLDKMWETEAKLKVFAPHDNDIESNELNPWARENNPNPDDVKPWWERIISNKH